MGIGQTFNVQRAMVVIVDGSGRAQAWEVQDGIANWEFAGVQDGMSTATIRVTGKFKRRSKSIMGNALKELLA